jgi:hypothetical protein
MHCIDLPSNDLEKVTKYGGPIAFRSLMRAREIRTKHAQAQRADVQDVFHGFDEHRRLVTLVKTMALEIERLNEETKQLRAAALIYREVARRSQTAISANGKGCHVAIDVESPLAQFTEG